jgi:hypothetical protein
VIRRRTLSRRGVRLDDLDFCHRFHWLAGWRPPRGDFERSRARWFTWLDFFTEYETLREQVLTTSVARHKMARPAGLWIETEYQQWVAAGCPVKWGRLQTSAGQQR